MEQPKIQISPQQIIKVKEEMATLKGMLNHIKSVVCDLKQTVQEKCRNSTSLSTDSGMSSETLPNQHNAENGLDSNKTLAEEMEQSDAAKLLLSLRNGPVLRPEKTLRYGVIRHNPNRIARYANEETNPESESEHPEQFSEIQPIDADLNEIRDTSETYLHKKKRAAKNIAIVKPRKPESKADMIPIGPGQTLVPKDAYYKIKWNSYTIATRKLLIAIFPRQVLATHSLTGKPSPAFANKPAKLCLDQRKVADIVITVTEKCKVKESLVRNAITTKCADENKMLRMKEKKNNTL